MVEKFRDKAKLWGEDAALLEQASKVLEEVLDRHADVVSVDWDRKDEQGQPVYTLTLRDLPDEGYGRFTREELQQPRRLRSLLLCAWGELLRNRSHRLLRDIREGGATEN